MKDSPASEAPIEVLGGSDRTFPPIDAFTSTALTTDSSLYDEAEADYEAFWARQARELVTWQKPFSKVLEWDPPNAKWFSDGQLNVSENCLDRHVEAGHGDRIAYYFEGEPGDTHSLTYAELLDEVKKFANVLKSLGLEKGDRAAIYMPMILEAPIAMLACTRIGVAHSVIFGGFSPEAIRDRCEDADCKVVITADAGYRRGVPFSLKPNVDQALAEGAPTVEHVVVFNRCGTDVEMVEGRDLWWHELMADASLDCPAEPMDAEQLLFLLYTSGTTAKPKGIMHTTGGFLTQVTFTHKYVFDIKPETDVYWCATDTAWITGHSYIVYGPLSNGVTSVIYEGTPDTPRQEERVGDDRSKWHKGRCWDNVSRYGVTQLYVAPTAIRAFMKWGEEAFRRYDLSSLRVLGSVGEPINPEAWMFLHENIGKGRVPIMDTWWQTETGAHMISPLPGVTATKPGSACHGIPGIFPELVDDVGQRVTEGSGYLTIAKPWPAMLRGVWGEPERYRSTYWDRFPGRYFAGDGAKLDRDGYYTLLGRVDDVMNVAGHRISATEVESALVDHPLVVEAAVVGASDDVKGEAIVSYVILADDAVNYDDLCRDLAAHVATKLGAISRPRDVLIVQELPKTRSGKIMRRILRNVAEGEALGDTTTLVDESVIDELLVSFADGCIAV